NDTLVGHDKIERRNFTALLGARFKICEFDFEDCAPRHLRDPGCDHPRGQRDFTLNIFVIPFRAAKISRNRFIDLGVEKGVGRKRRGREQDRHDRDRSLMTIYHAPYRSRGTLDTAAESLSVSAL